MCVLTLLEAEIFNKLLYSLILLLNTALKLESCSESQSFFDSEVGKNDIILHHIASIVAKKLLV